MDKVNEILNNKKLLQDIRTVLIVLVSLGLPMLYFGFFGQITIEQLLTVNVAGLAVISIISVWIVRIDVGIRAEYDEIENNDELKKELSLSEELKRDVNNIDLAIEFTNKYNKEKQEKADKLKTEKRIQRLENLIKLKKINRKDYSKLEKEIERIKQYPLRDNKFKPVRVDKMISFGNESVSEDIQGDGAYNYNPKTDGWKRSLAFSVVKFLGIGGTGSIPFILGESVKNIVIYYIALILTLFITILSRYIKVRKLTEKKYLQTVKRSNSFLKDMIKYIGDNSEKKNEEGEPKPHSTSNTCDGDREAQEQEEVHEENKA